GRGGVLRGRCRRLRGGVLSGGSLRCGSLRGGSGGRGRRALAVPLRGSGLPPTASGLPGGLHLLLCDAPRLLACSGGTAGGTLCLGGAGRSSRAGRGGGAPVCCRGGAVGRGQSGSLVPQHQAGGEQLEVEPRRGRPAHGREGL